MWHWQEFKFTNSKLITTYRVPFKQPLDGDLSLFRVVHRWQVWEDQPPGRDCSKRENISVKLFVFPSLISLESLLILSESISMGSFYLMSKIPPAALVTFIYNFTLLLKRAHVESPYINLSVITHTDSCHVHIMRSYTVSTTTTPSAGFVASHAL